MANDRSVSAALFDRRGIWLVIFLALYNNLVNILPSSLHEQLYLGLNLGVLFLVWIMSQRYLALKPVEIGMTKANLGKTVLVGIVLTGAVIGPFVLLLHFLPKAGVDIKGPHLKSFSPAILWLRVFFRIPLGTALFEEMLFRGIFFGFLARSLSDSKTIVVSSVFFAIWHITPALQVIHYNFRINDMASGAGLLALGLAGAFTAGLALAVVRSRTKNLWGSVLAHALINTITLVVVYYRWSS